MTVVEQHSADQLQQLFRQERDALRSKRSWIVWQARLGLTALQIADGIGMSRRAVQHWVQRYNQEGLAGLETCTGRGRRPILSADERRALVQRVEAGPQQDDVCSLRGVDFQPFVQTQFGKLLSLTTVYRLLHELGYQWLVPRPKHRKSDPDAVAEFKKSAGNSRST